MARLILASGSPRRRELLAHVMHQNAMLLRRHAEPADEHERRNGGPASHMPLSSHSSGHLVCWALVIVDMPRMLALVLKRFINRSAAGTS